MAQESQADGGMKFLVDECLSPSFVQMLANRGYPDSSHPKYVGWLQAEDHVLVRRALEQDRIIVTANADDFRTLLASTQVHPGLITLPNATLHMSWRLLDAALTFIELHPDPAGYMINRAIELSSVHGIRAYELPGT